MANAKRDGRNKKCYQRASKKEKGKILDDFIELTGYHRVYARSLLRTVDRKIVRA